ncbi:hypothetical protein EYE40_14530 [Glaciihabitans arcticus]|uniref:Uncharacterized protein n=1 Tax=Glaciihabitans arcticus TaxID=2668039 RepID=A0A4Q9GM99_9MICO|nr:hypothetical protein [Glaciihabitans arcticus]TBN55422.1 hypothetical protein EYE40_14530 [Glaciihabitans arcticus]
MIRERTLQQRDPLAALVGRPTSLLAAIAVPFYAAIMIALNVEDVVDPILAVMSLLLTVATGVVFARASNPMRAPFDRPSMVLVVGGALLAHVFGAASMWGENAYVRDDWGPSVVGLFLLAVAPFRPARSIAVAGVISTIVVAVTTVAQYGTLASAAPIHVLVVVAVTPVLALAAGSAVFAHELVASLDRWESLATMSTDALVGSRSDGIARSVQQDRVTILNQDVVPYFTRVLAASSVTDADRGDARSLAENIRAVMVAEADRSWLDGVLEQLGGVAGGSAGIRDESHLADLMTIDQRTVLRAVLVALHGQAGFEPGSLDIKLVPHGVGYRLSLGARVDVPAGALHELLDPYLAVMQILFRDLRVEMERPALRLGFGYGHR